MTLEVFTMLKHRPNGGATAIASATHGPSPDSDDDNASLFELAVHDGDGRAAGSNSDRELSLSTSCGGGGGSLRCSLSFPSDDHFVAKPGTKLRVLMVDFEKPVPPTPPASAKRQRQQSWFFVNLKPDEAVPSASHFTRTSTGRAASPSPAPQERRPSRDGLQRYLSKIKPLYARVSKKYGRQLSSLKPDGSPASHGGGLAEGRRGVSRKLGKSMSASAAVRSPSLPRRRDDSLLEQEDGIQSAIAHCKRSFNAGREAPESRLGRSMSDPGGRPSQ